MCSIKNDLFFVFRYEQIHVLVFFSFSQLAESLILNAVFRSVVKA